MDISTKDFGDYSVKAIKSFVGMEGYGFNANLYRGKKKVAFCIDSADGGMVDIEWTVGKRPKLSSEYTDKDVEAKDWEEYRKARKIESDLLAKHIASLPKVKSDYGDKKMELTIDEGWFVSDLVAKWEEGKEERKMQKQCKTKTLYKLKGDKYGQHWIMKAEFNEKTREYLHKKYGDKLLEIINDRF